MDYNNHSVLPFKKKIRLDSPESSNNHQKPLISEPVSNNKENMKIKKKLNLRIKKKKIIIVNKE